MIILGNTPVITTVQQVMTALQRELRINGSMLLHDVLYPKSEGQDVQFTCPFHKNGMETRPSCGITTREQLRGSSTIPVGTFHCFTCHAHGDITELISKCYGKDDGGIFGKKWILDRFNNYEVESRSGFFKRWGTKREEKPITYVSEDELSKYRYIHPYHYKRHLTDDILEVYDIGYDKAFKLGTNTKPFACITFPVKDINGNVLFIARRSIKGKIYHYPHSAEKPIYGLYEALKLFPDSKELYICESMLNALMFSKWGKPAVALLGTGTKTQTEQLKQLEYRKYVLCLDPDEAGKHGAEKLYTSLHKYKLVQQLRLPTGVDVNDLGYCQTYEEFLEEIKKREVTNNGKN